MRSTRPPPITTVRSPALRSTCTRRCEIPLELGRAAAAPSESSGNGGGAQAPEEPGPTADLVVRTNDPLVPVEVADQAGRVLQVSNGGVSLAGLAPGFYRVRLIPPGGAVDEQVVELAPGDEQIVDLERIDRLPRRAGAR